MEWLAKKVVASLVNRYLGQYLEDLDTQEVNDALLSGQVNLTNLKIRRDALVSCLYTGFGCAIYIWVPLLKSKVISNTVLKFKYKQTFYTRLYSLL